MNTHHTADFKTTRDQYLTNVQRDIERWRKGYDEMEAGALPVASKDRAELRRVWLELENAYRDLQKADEASWPAAQRRSQRSAQAFRDTWVVIVTRINVEEKSEIGWLQGFTDDLSTASSEGWVEGMGEQTDDLGTASSEGWVEGVGEQTDDSEGWTEGLEKTQS